MAVQLSSPCFSRIEITEFASGRVSPRECERMALHVESCHRCLQELEAVELKADVLLSSLRATDNCSAAGQQTFQVAAGTHETSSPSSSRTSTARFENLPADFGRYRILKPLGRGGMGAVFLAHDTQLDRTVALKVPFFDGRDSAAAEQRFFREARAAATIEHPHVCPVFDVGRIDNTPFLTMPYISGQSVSQKLKGNWRPCRRDVARLGLAIADGLAAAHRSGIVHRDVKPGNILLDEKNKPLLTDFGLARRHSESTCELTRSGELIGSPLYMSPEQARGDLTLVGPASDQYSLAIVMFELLTGRPPFQGSLLDVLNQIQNGEIARISDLRSDAPDKLDAIVHKATSRAISDRYGSLDELAKELKVYVRGAAVPAAKPKVAAKRFPPSRPSAKKVVACVGALALLAGIVVIVSTSGGSVEVQLHEPGTQLRILQGDRERRLLTSSPETQRLRLPAGEYRVEIIGGDGSQQPSPDRIILRWGDREIVRIVPKPAINAPPEPTGTVMATPPAQAPVSALQSNAAQPTAPVVAADPPTMMMSQSTTSDFVIPVTGLPSVDSLKPSQAVEQWRQPQVFANLATSGALHYPELPAEDYVFETDFELVTPGGFLVHEFGDTFFRVLILFEWDPGKSLYRCRLQRRHGKGSWFINWKHFKPGERVSLRLVRHQGVALLFDRDRQILDIDSVPVKPQLKLTYGGETPREGTIYHCKFRSLTSDEQQHAQSELQLLRQPQPVTDP